MSSYRDESYQVDVGNNEEAGVHFKLNENSGWLEMPTSKRRMAMLGTGAFSLTAFFILLGVLYSPSTTPPITQARLSATPMSAATPVLAATPVSLETPMLAKTPEPFVFPEKVHLELGFYVNTPKGQVRGTNAGYIDWSNNPTQPNMRWDELYDVASINDVLPLLYDGVAGPNADGNYKYWSMDRNGNFKCTDFPFPKAYPRDLLKKEGTYHGQSLVNGKAADVWSYGFMGVTVVIYVDAQDNTKLLKEEISIDTGKPQKEVVQVYDQIKLTAMTSEIDESIFTTLPNNC